jgi:hypothetical protein
LFFCSRVGRSDKFDASINWRALCKQHFLASKQPKPLVTQLPMKLGDHVYYQRNSGLETCNHRPPALSVRPSPRAALSFFGKKTDPVRPSLSDGIRIPGPVTGPAAGAPPRVPARSTDRFPLPCMAAQRGACLQARPLTCRPATAPPAQSDAKKDVRPRPRGANGAGAGAGAGAGPGAGAGGGIGKEKENVRPTTSRPDKSAPPPRQENAAAPRPETEGVASNRPKQPQASAGNTFVRANRPLKPRSVQTPVTRLAWKNT